MQEVASHSAAKKIFEYFVECYIPSMYLYSQEYVDAFGMYTSGNESVDIQNHQKPIRVQLTVAQMAKHFSDGASISLVEPEESKQIYGWIVEHIGDWQNEITRDPNRLDVPIEDLRILEKFAEAIYPMARNFMTVVPSGSTLFRSLDRLGRRAIRRNITVAEKQNPDVPIAHSPMAQHIANELARRGK